MQWQNYYFLIYLRNFPCFNTNHQLYAVLSFFNNQLFSPTAASFDEQNTLREINDIDDAITQSLVAEFDMDEQQAIDIYFQSNIYGRLID